MMTSVLGQCLEAVAEIIRGLALPGLNHDSIRVARLPWIVGGDGNVIINPGIVVHPVRERTAPGTNVREDIGYGCAITMIRPASHSSMEDVDIVNQWREAIRQRLVEARLDDIVVDDGHYCITKIEHNELNVPREGHRYEISSIVARCWVREARTS